MKTCYVAALVLAIAVVSCKQDKRTGDIITKKPVAEVHKTIQKTGDYSQTRHVNWLGNDYSIIVQRTAETNSTVVDEGSGNQYYNNKIVVRILRKDGTEFFKREFTKLIGFLVVAMLSVGLVFNAAGVKDVLLNLFNQILGA